MRLSKLTLIVEILAGVGKDQKVFLPVGTPHIRTVVFLPVGTTHIRTKVLYFIFSSIFDFFFHMTLRVGVFPSQSRFDTYCIGVLVSLLVRKHTLCR